jgi:acetolactate synthase I/II/III large subunit
LKRREIAADSVGEAWLALLGLRGVDYLFANAGTDFPSIVEALAKPRDDGLNLPQPILAAHENVAVGMAHGFAMVTGRPQAVMVHVNVGTANALGGLFNAGRDHVPMLFAAGRTPILESGAPGSRTLNIHWAQEMFDQGGMLREAAKWDYELRDAAQLEAVTDRALSIAMSEPRGPVALALPREVLARPVGVFSVAEQSLQQPAAPAAPDRDALSRIAVSLARARHPLVITASAGRDERAPELLATLADRLALRVVEFRPRYLNLANDHPMHGGFEVDPYLAEADAILTLDCDVPWIPQLKTPRPDCPVFQIGGDVLFQRYPMRSFRADIAVPCSPVAAIPTLLKLIDGSGADAARVAARRSAYESAHRELRADAIAAAENAPGEGPMTMAWASLCLARALPQDSIVTNEYPLVRPVMNFTQAGSFFGSSPVGCLGWGVPAALGAQLATRDRVVVAAVGDGSYLFANPLACHQVAAAQNLPLLTIVFDNAGWEAVRRATRSLYPNGHAARANRMPLSTINPAPRYDQVAQACGGWGERVERAGDLPAALERALHVVQNEKRQALLSLACR